MKGMKSSEVGRRKEIELVSKLNSKYKQVETLTVLAGVAQLVRACGC